MTQANEILIVQVKEANFQKYTEMPSRYARAEVATDKLKLLVQTIASAVKDSNWNLGIN